MRIFITGTAGFIGFHLAKLLCSSGHHVYGIDSINDYYDVTLKQARLKECGIDNVDYGQEVTSTIYSNYIFKQVDLCDNDALKAIFNTHHFDCVVNLAAQAGVRYSIVNPHAYISSNVAGFMNVLELCRNYKCNRLIYASSSSVYGNSIDVPFKETAQVDQPISIYAATKKSNETMAFTYSHLYNIQCIGLRFFTVYGPWGRPDMAPMIFADAIRKNESIKIFNHGELSRDFTFVKDIVEGIAAIIEHPENAREDVPGTPAVIYNIGHGSPIKLLDFIHTLENNFNTITPKEFVGMQSGDVYQTWADTTKLAQDFNYIASTPLKEGIEEFAQWYMDYYKSNK